MHPAMMEELGRQRRQDLVKLRGTSRHRSRWAVPGREAAGWLLVRAGLSLVAH
jgi:hypothetical protein